MIGRVKKFVGFCLSCVMFLYEVLYHTWPLIVAGICIVTLINCINDSEAGLSSYKDIDKLKSEITDERWHQSLREKLSDKKLSIIEVSNLESLARDIEKEAAVAKLNGN